MKVDLAWSAIIPRLALSTDRTQVAKSNPLRGGPDDWLRSDVLSTQGAKGIQFDFFVNWANLQIDHRIWVKRVAVRDRTASATDTSVASVAAALAPWKSEVDAVAAFAAKYQFEERWVIIPEWWDWTAPEARMKAKVLFATVEAGNVAHVQAVDIPSLESEIAVRSGQRFKIGKGLIYSTSGLEGMLSRGETPWPGDADLVLLDSSSNKTLGVVEYKKHTLATDIRPTFSDYYPGPDSRRWDRLAILAQHLDAPLYCLYYSVKPNESRTYLQRIGGQPGALVPAPALAIEAPGSTDETRHAYAAAVLETVRQAAG